MASIEKVKEELINRGYKVEERDTIKNGVALKGIMVGKNGSKAMPIIYLDHIERYNDVDSAVEFIVDAIKKSEKFEETAEDLKKYEVAKNNIYKIVLNLKNQDTLPMVKIAGDIGYAFVIDFGENYHAKITHKVLKSWGVDVNTLMADSKIRDTYMNTLADVLTELTGGGIDIDNIDEPLPFLIISNYEKNYGGVNVFADKSIQEKLATLFDNKFYIIPSSVHETLVLPVSEDEGDIENLKNMITQVNATEVSDTDFLSNMPFMYDNGEFKEI